MKKQFKDLNEFIAEGLKLREISDRNYKNKRLYVLIFFLIVIYMAYKHK